jgi:hypothetical protein
VRRALPFVALLAASLGGCPLPQPLPAVQRVDGTTVTPPRVVADSATPQQAVVRVGTTCAAGSVLPFSAVLEDPNLDDPVQARWFVDYDAGSTGVQRFEDVLRSPDDADPLRTLAAPFMYRVDDHGQTLPHVVELVVSNGFYEIGGDPPGARVNRSPRPGFETQVFRWVVVHDAGAPCP